MAHSIRQEQDCGMSALVFRVRDVGVDYEEVRKKK